MKKKKIISAIIFNGLVFVLALIGLIDAFTTSGFMSAGTVLYFTIDANILLGYICLVFMILNIIKLKKDIPLPKWLIVFKYMCSITIVCIFSVFLFMLLPQMILQGTWQYLFTLQNICLHFLVPIFGVITFIFTDDYDYKKSTCLYSPIIPFCYMSFIYLIVNLTGKSYFRTIDGFTKYPYFFMDFEVNGWFTLNNGIMGLGTFWWFLIFSVIFFPMGYLLIVLNKKANKK